MSDYLMIVSDIKYHHPDIRYVKIYIVFIWIHVYINVETELEVTSLVASHKPHETS